MNIVQYFKDKVDLYNQEQRCGFCYEFSAPLFENKSNEYQQQNDECCVKVFITNLRLRSLFDNSTDKILGYSLSNKCAYSFDLYFLKSSRMDINNYNEISGHPIEESKWNTIFEPLLNCFGCIVNECTDIDNLQGYTKWETVLVNNYLDQNYDGIKISAELIIQR